MSHIQTGTRLRPDALQVPRHQTDQLCAWLEQGGLVYLVGSYQIGKSTLADTAVRKLKAEEQASHAAVLDLGGAVEIGSGSEFHQICQGLARELGLQDDYRNWREAQGEGGGRLLWLHFLEDFLLSRLDGRIVLVFDELDELANQRGAPGSRNDGDGSQLGFNDDFLLALRSLHNAAPAHESLRRLSFCLVGTRPPAWLVSDPKRTPMNVGKTLVLEDFTAEEAAAFLPHLEPVASRPQALLDEVLAWTSGHPLLTAELIHTLEQGERVPLRSERGAVQELVNQLYLKDGLSRHNVLSSSGRRIRADEPQAPSIRRLETYELVLERGAIDYRAAEPIHLALILDGLLGIAEDAGDRYLVPRNEIFRRLFDVGWVRALRAGALYEAPSETGAAPASDALKTVCRAVQELLAGDFYELLDGGVEELAGILFSFSVSTIHGNVRKPLRLQVYRGLTGVALELWEQEVRALERLSGTRSATLPALHEAGISEDRDLAYTLTDRASRQLSDPGSLDRLRDDPGLALRELLLLAKGLMALQRQGLIHRNLWGGNVEVIERHDGATLSLRLARFQMSMLLGNMLRRLGETRDAPADLGELDQAVRDFFLAQGREALACAPPERLAFLFNQPELDSLESSAGDVYSLGMIGYQLFVGPVPDSHLLAAFPDSPDGGVGFSLAAFRELHREIRARLHQHRRLSKLLRELLVEMTRWTAAARPTIFQLTSALEAGYDTIQRSFEPKTDQKFILSYMPEQMADQYRTYRWMVHDPATEQGEEELWELVSQDLRDTAITFSERGAAPFVNRSDDRHKRAQFVLLGRKATYFGQLFEDRSSAGVSGIPLPQVFLITFSCEKKKCWQLSENKLQRRLPPFKLVSYRDPLVAPQRVKDFPSWMPLLQSVTSSHLSAAQEKFERALDWLLEVERCEQTVRQYAVLTEKSAGGTILRWDKARDRERFFRNTFQTFYAADRPDFGDFFNRLSREESSQLLFEANRGGELRWVNRRYSSRVTFLRRLDPDSIQVQVEGELAERGWLRPEGEVGSFVQLFRQTEARHQLSQMPNLVSQLLAPRALQRRSGTWLGAGDGLQGNAAQIIRRLLDTRPFFALQGPPGTGKTTVTARAVALALKHDRSQRILISAQSHYALDHLAKKVLGELREAGLNDVSALRIVTESSEGRVEDREIQALLPKNRVDALLQRLGNSRPEAGLAGHPQLQELAGRWRRTATSHALEIQDRLRRGANVLFATTGTATAELLGLEDQRAVCDWAIIEEASKASPTELAIPMVQARRWTLIGDHFQLPPFGKEKLEALLRRCLRETEPEIRQHGERFDEYMQAFELFGHLFKEGANTAVDRLNLQFRMDRTIGDLVSRTFYDKELKTADSAGQGGLEVRRPAGLRGHRLLWVESGRAAREEPFWSNAREVQLVAELVEGLMKNRPEPGPDQLVVLSPYRQQIEALRRELGQYANRVHTIDSFQGKEADVVIVSLVRVNRNASARERLGFLASPNRINVMMSRARKLLVLVGSYEHFKTSGILFWERICAEVVTSGGGVVTGWQA